MTDAEIRNYEVSYARMWREVEDARRLRDKALKIVDVAVDLTMALRHDLAGDLTKVSLTTVDALNRLESRLNEVKPYDDQART